ncbi:molybdate ABC transporter substrate-binding protein [Yoonia sp. SDW83-1]|uniref:molybdate ABC transporter substrate-binding protein n=1 Tax=Yoonia sp. SDW83-1 TaxID=3366945 RepID=UPI00398C55FC
MKARIFTFVFWLILATATNAEVVVFAAASLKEPLDAMAADFGDVTLSYGGSGTLARQLTLGAPADVVVLANDEWMQALVTSGRISADGIVDLASNRLVLIGTNEASDVPLTGDGIGNALGSGRIAVGLTEAVPAGIYAKAALTSLNLWPAFADRLAEVDNVRAALTLVIREQTPLGIVYATDARVSEAVRIVATFPADSHPPIRYLGAVTSDKAEAGAFLAHMSSPAGRAQFAAAGFLPPQDLTQ